MHQFGTFQRGDEAVKSHLADAFLYKHPVFGLTPMTLIGVVVGASKCNQLSNRDNRLIVRNKELLRCPQLFHSLHLLARLSDLSPIRREDLEDNNFAKLHMFAGMIVYTMACGHHGCRLCSIAMI